MKTIYLFVCIVVVNSFGQNGPPPEVDVAIRSTIQILMHPNPDLREYIQQYYSRELISSNSIDKHLQKIEEIRKNTAGAGGIDIEVDNGIFKLIFSEGNNAVVLLEFDENEEGKIASLSFEEKRDPSQMTEQERYQNAFREAVRKIESLANIKGNNELKKFASENFAPELLLSFSEKELNDMLRKIGLAVAASSTISSRPGENNKGVVLEFRGGKSADIHFSIEDSEPYRINKLFVDTDVSNFPPSMEQDLIPLSWDNYKDQLKKEEAKGFAGTVLVVRNGKIVHHQGYSFQNREKKIPNSMETIYDIGSIPIDFTRAAILKLVDEGKIGYSDRITKFLDNVPNDKTQMTIEHLMTDRSGLPNFHGDESKDEDLDLTWIDRDEAIQRMMNSQLLFEPGSERSPSHSGYGLLAAIVELVSGKTYEEFLNESFFDDMRMENTGQFGMQPGFDQSNMAVGYGKQISDPNIPSNWGKTSWLVKGSGGMVSTPYDLYLWNTKLHVGDYLSDKSKEKYGFGFMSVGGSERGFFSVYDKDAQNTVIICTNSHHAGYRGTMTLFKSLLNLIDKDLKRN